LKAKHKEVLKGLSDKRTITQLKYDKLILLGEKRISDLRGSLQVAAAKDRRAALWQGILWGAGGTLVIVTVATVAVAVILYFLNNPSSTKTQGLVFRHQLLLEGVIQ